MKAAGPIRRTAPLGDETKLPRPGHASVRLAVLSFSKMWLM